MEDIVSLGLLILRLVVGLGLAAHGAQKLLGWFGGYGLRGTGQFLEQLGFRPGRFQAAQAGLAEMGGGLLLALGFLTPLAAAAVVAVMLVAAVSVHLEKGFFAQSGGYEYPLVLATTAVTLAFTGPGVVSLDHALGLSWAGEAWGFGALVAGGIGGAVPLALRAASRRSAAERVA
jgi:putative oxidoreductase